MGHKTNLNKLKRAVIIQGMFSDCNEIKLKISNGTPMGKLNNIAFK